MYDKAYSNPDSLSITNVRHLLLHFTNFAVNYTELVCLSFNQQTHHTNIRGMIAKVKGNRYACHTISTELLLPEFGAKLKQAVCEPYGKCGDYIIDKVTYITYIE